MILTKKATKEELEEEYLLQHLQYSADVINKYLPSYHAIIDKSGDIPQQHVHKK